MAKGEQNAPSIGQTPTHNSATTHAAPLPNVLSPDPLQGFKPEAKRCGQHIRKPSAYVCDIQEGQGVSSTHPSNPILPCRLQQPSHISHHATTAIPKDRMDDGHPTIEYAMMAAANIVGTDPVSISNMKRCEDWPEWDWQYSAN